MRFTHIPAQYAPLGGKVVYAFDTEAPSGETPVPDTLICITDAADGTLLGAKRFVGVTTAAFDAAPYLRRAVRFVPTGGGTGFYSAQDRIVTVRVEAATVEQTGAEVAEAGEPPIVALQTVVVADSQRTIAPDRTFLPCTATVDAPAILTSMPFARLIAPGECDELTLLTDGPCTAMVTAETAEGLVAQSYNAAQAGVHLFRLDTRDFSEARTITVDAGACGTVVYTLLTAPEGARRIAWRSEVGSVEHYTFPVERAETVVALKTPVEGPEGRFQVITGCERRTVLASAYESRAVLEGLTGIVCTAQIWEIAADEYLPVEVRSNEAAIHRHGALSLLEIEICSTRKTSLSWN